MLIPAQGRPEAYHYFNLLLTGQPDGLFLICSEETSDNAIRCVVLN